MWVCREYRRNILEPPHHLALTPFADTSSTGQLTLPSREGEVLSGDGLLGLYRQRRGRLCEPAIGYSLTNDFLRAV